MPHRGTGRLVRLKGPRAARDLDLGFGDLVTAKDTVPTLEGEREVSFTSSNDHTYLWNPILPLSSTLLRLGYVYVYFWRLCILAL
eukprot:scaffold70006_cov31-Tisochrysis_lutea.AAC.3